MSRPRELTELESAFALMELRRGRRFDYHRMTNEHPLKCYLADRPQDPGARIPDAETGRAHQITADECESIVARNIEFWKHEHKPRLTDADLAEALGCSTNYVPTKLATPSKLDSATVRRLCDLLGVNLDQLIYRESAEPDPDAPMTPDKVKAIYSKLSKRHQKMISEMVWELFDGECANKETSRLIDEIVAMSC